MEQYKQEFINFMVQCDVLKFGEFTLKSGRKSPFFMNAGAYAATEGISLFLNRDLPAIVMEHDGALLQLRQHLFTESLNENERMFGSHE